MIRLNQSLEAFQYGGTLALFANDRSLTLEGGDNIEFFHRLKRLLAQPRTEGEIQDLEPDIYDLLPALISAEILIQDKVRAGTLCSATDSILDRAIVNHFSLNQYSVKTLNKIIICFPDTTGLHEQKRALRSLKEKEGLLTGIYRATTVFTLPLITDPNTDIYDLISKLLSTEPGIGNLYLAEELGGIGLPASVASKTYPFNTSAAAWVAADICALINNNLVSMPTARIYKGSIVKREDIDLAAKTDEFPIAINAALDDKLTALEERFLGKAKIAYDCREFSIGNVTCPLYLIKSTTARTRTQSMRESESLSGWGTGTTKASARLSAIMESIERYAIETYEIDDHPLVDKQDLSYPLLDPSTVACYGENDVAFSECAAGDLRRWHKVYNSKHEVFLLPLELVRYPLDAQELGYIPNHKVTSSGVAAHFDHHLALSAACHELVERDAFLIAWLRKAAPPLIEITSLPPKLLKVVNFIVEKGWTVKILDLTSDLAPVVCVLLSKAEYAWQYSMGASSKDDVEAACEKALQEAYCTTCLPVSPPRSARDVLENIATPSDHLELYATHVHDDKLLRMFSSEQKRNFSDIKKFSKNIIERISEVGMDLYYADMRSKKLETIAPEIFVVRAIVPGLVPIQFGKHWTRTGCSRIRDLPEILGWPTGAKLTGDYERFPHPFP